MIELSITLTEYGFSDESVCKTRSTPLDSKFIERSKLPYESIAPTPIQQKLGSALYLAVRTRPDIMAYCQMLAVYASNPNTYIEEQVVWLWGYIKKTKREKLVIGGVPAQKDLLAVCDASHIEDPFFGWRRGCTVLYLNGGCIGFKSENLANKTNSSTGSEYFSALATLQMSQHVVNIIEELGQFFNEPTMLVDNLSTLSMIMSIALTPQMKAIAGKYHVLRQHVLEKKLRVFHIPTDLNVADLGTKILSQEKTTTFRRQILNPMKYLDIMNFIAERERSGRVENLTKSEKASGRFPSSRGG